MTFDLQFGAIDLVSSPNTTPGYWFQALGEDMELGNPEAVEREIASFLQDGSIATIESWDNRTMTLPVAVCATNPANLALGELVLALQVQVGRGQLAYTPSGNGATCVFDVVNSKLGNTFDDILETNVINRVYTLTIVAGPFARAAADVAFSWSAPPAGTPTTATVDACNATTNWTGSPNAAATSGGYVTETVSNSGSSSVNYNPSLTRASIGASMSSTPFAVIDYSIVGGGNGGIPALGSVTIKINGTTVTEVSSSGTRHWFAMPGGATTWTSFQILVSGVTLNPGTFMQIKVNDLSQSSASADSTGQRQTQRSVTVQGSARTQPTLMLSDATPAALGSVLVYTSPNSAGVFQPPLRAFRTAGSAETSDSSLVSGKYSALSTMHVFDIPASQVPAGTYLFMARVRNPSTGVYSMTWTARSRMGSTNLDATAPTGTRTVSLVSNVWTVTPVATMVLPTRLVGSSGLVRIELTAPGNTQLDEAWLFNLDLGRLTWVECDTGTPAAGGPASRVFLKPASLDSPVPQVLLGTASDGSDAFGAGDRMQSFGDHEFQPGANNVWTMSSNSVAMQGDGTYPPRFMTHVA